MAIPSVRVLATLTGHKNKNFPIQSSIYRGQKYVWNPAASRSSAGGGAGDGGISAGVSRLRKGMDTSMLLATGSAVILP
jgi:hypothetical protein